MKTIVSLAAMAVVGLLTANNVQASFANTNALPVQVKLTGLVESPETVKSNSNGTVITTTVKTTKVKVTSQDILNLLATEFDIIIPDGSLLAYTANEPEEFVVTDANGAIILNVSSNLLDPDYLFDITDTNFVDATQIEAEKAAVDASTTNETASVTLYSSDENFRYADGEGNHFHVIGLAVEKGKIVTTPSSTTIPTVSLIISPAQGGGTFFNPNDTNYDEAVFTGSITLKGKNLTED